MPQPRAWLNLILLLATVLTTLLVGADSTLMQGSIVRGLLSGWPFSLSILLILGAHELGHYFAAQWHGYPVSLPYFIPFPPPISPLGTMGALIVMSRPTASRRALFDIAAAGPLAGLLFAIPILIVGLAASEIAPLPSDQSYLLEGNSLLYAWLKRVILGASYPVAGVDVQLSQMAWAGWGGLLLTALNLLPVGTLDGGHIAYAVLGKRARWLFWPVIIALVGLSVWFATPMWIVWIGLLLLFGRRHARPLDDETKVGRGRVCLAFLLLLVFVLLFVPVPLRVVG